MQRQSRIEVTAELTQFVRGAHFRLRFGKAQISRLLNVESSSDDVQWQVVLGDIDLGNFSGL
jgi:hypothetical protein